MLDVTLQEHYCLCVGTKGGSGLLDSAGFSGA
jgi:hypothetical protein